MIVINDLKKTFPLNKDVVHAVNGVNLTIQDGDIYGVVGYSGAGKSTLVRCLNFLEIPDSGSISFSGFGTVTAKNGKLYHVLEGEEKETILSDKNLRKLRSSIGMIFQHFNLLDRSTVFENVAYPLKYTGLKKEEIRKRVYELLELVDLKEKVNSYPSELSGGQKQRVAIARALANNPKILLSDEATSALDPDVTESILELLKDLNQKLGVTIILITHEMSVVKSICQKMAVMEKGKVVEEGNVYDIFENPQAFSTKRFVNSSSGLSTIDKLVDQKAGIVDLTSNSRLVKLTFGKDCVGEALISDISRRYNVDVNIVLANVEMLQDIPLGGIIALCKGDPAKVIEALNYLESCNVKVEVIADGMA